MIPVFDANGNLPPGIHVVTWNELVARFGTTPHRQMLLDGLRAALLSLKDSGCRRVYIDGSFVTAKEEPGDFDGCWEVDALIRISWTRFCWNLRTGVPHRRRNITVSCSWRMQRPIHLARGLSISFNSTKTDSPKGLSRLI